MRSIIYGLGCFVLSCSNALASVDECFSTSQSCQNVCVAGSLAGALMGRSSGLDTNVEGCLSRCEATRDACVAREQQQQFMEQQRQQAQENARRQQKEAAERQTQQARDAKEVAGRQQSVQQAGEIAKRVSAEAAIQQQFDAAMEKGMQALDQKGWITAEYQFKAALKIKPSDIEAKSGLLRALVGAGRRAAAITYANEQLLALAAHPPGANGRSAYSHWLEVLSDNGLANDAERSQLDRIYPFGGGDPENAAASFPGSNPKSAFLPFVRQIGSVIPAILADIADRRKAVETRALEQARAEESLLKASAEAKVRAQAEAIAKAEADAKVRDQDQVELAAWTKIENSTDVAQHKDFLEKFPKGRYADEAKYRSLGRATDRSFPNKAVRIIVGFAPGGPADDVAGLVAEKMSKEWNQPVSVENKPGAGATIAATYVAGSPPDGYTLLLIRPDSHALSSAAYRKLPYDALTSFAGVGQVASAPLMVVVNPAMKINTMKELIELARSKPGQVSYSYPGGGTSGHLATEMIAMATGIKLLSVPYKGGAPAVAALLRAEVDFSVVESVAIPFVQSGKLRALAVTSASQSPLLPGVPTLAEAGVPGVEVPLAIGILTPAGTPPEVILKINVALTRAVGGEDVRRRLSALGLESAPKSPEEFSVFLASEVQKYTKFVKFIGLRIE